MTRISQLTLIFRDKLQALNQKDSDVVSLVSSSETIKRNSVQLANLSASWPSFQMPRHYPNFTKEEYELMSEEELDRLFRLYGMPTNVGELSCKKEFAIGAFLWEKEVDSPMAKHDSADADSFADVSGESSLVGLIVKLKNMVGHIFRV